MHSVRYSYSDLCLAYAANTVRVRLAVEGEVVAVVVLVLVLGVVAVVVVVGDNRDWRLGPTIPSSVPAMSAEVRNCRSGIRPARTHTEKKCMVPSVPAPNTKRLTALHASV